MDIVPRFVIAGLIALGATLLLLGLARPARGQALWPCSTVVSYCQQYTPRELKALQRQHGVSCCTREQRAHIRACLRGVRCKR